MPKYVYSIHMRYMTRKNLTFPQTTAGIILIHAAVRICPRGQSARTLRGFRTDNQRILCGTISRFRVEFCECKTKITQSIDIRTILATCLSILQPVVVHQVRLLVSAIFNLNPHRRSAPARTHGKSVSTCAESASASVKVPRHPCGKSASFLTTICGCPRGTTMEFLGKS